MEVPATLYVAFGAVAAALVAGFFSFLNLVSSKENKVSEFRQSWIDGLRTEIATHSAALQAIVRFISIKDLYEDRTKWHEATKDIYRDVSESLTKIQLRLNPTHAKEHPESQEAMLLKAIEEARDLMAKDDLKGAFGKSQEIRSIAAPLLKSEWERVKNGEERYQKIRDRAQSTIRYGIILLGIFATVALLAQMLIAAS